MHSFRKGKLSLGICPESRTSSAYPETLKPPSAGGHAGWQGWPASAHEPPRCPSPVVRGQTPPILSSCIKSPGRRGVWATEDAPASVCVSFTQAQLFTAILCPLLRRNGKNMLKRRGGWQHGQDQVVFSAALLKPQPSVAL